MSRPYPTIGKHEMYCPHCYTVQRIFLSTTEEQKESFLSFHSACLSDREKLAESYPGQLRDWKARARQRI
jgi:hypothetical protein